MKLIESGGTVNIRKTNPLLDIGKIFIRRPSNILFHVEQINPVPMHLGIILTLLKS